MVCRLRDDRALWSPFAPAKRERSSKKMTERPASGNTITGSAVTGKITHNVIATGLLHQPLIPDRVLLLGLLLANTCLTSALLLASADPRYSSTTILLSDVTRFSRSWLAPGSRIHQIPSRNSDKDEGYECSGVANSAEPTWHEVPA